MYIGDKTVVFGILNWILLLFLLTTFLAVTLKHILANYLLLFSFFFFGAISVQIYRSERTIESDFLSISGIGTISEVKPTRTDWFQYIVDIEHLYTKGDLRSAHENILVLSKSKLRRGDKVAALFDLTLIENRGNPGEFDLKGYWNAKNIRYQCFWDDNDYRLIDRGGFQINMIFSEIRKWSESLIETYVPSNAVGMNKAILLGAKGGLETETIRQFQEAGAVHVLAVSGLHVGIVMLLLNFVFQRSSRRISKRTAIILTIVLSFIYAGITGFSPSVVRAFIMFSLLLIAQLTNRITNPLNTLGFAAFIMVIVNPLIIYDLGFQLSFLAMMGILIFYKDIESWFYIRNKLIRKFWQGTAVGIAAQLTTLPLVLYHFGQFANYFWLSNLLVMAFAGLLLGVGLSFLILGKVPLISKLLGLALGLLSSIFLESISYVSNLPFAVAYGFEKNVGILIALYMLILLLFLFRAKKNWIKPLGVTAVCLLLLVQFKRYEGLSANEFIVFNSTQTCLLYREGKTCIAFVDDVPEDRVVRMVDDYVRRFNGKVIFHDLSLHHEYAIGNNIWINKDESNNLYFEIVDKRYSIIRSYKSFPVRKSTRIYAAYIEAPPGAISLAQGYLKFEF